MNVDDSHYSCAGGLASPRHTGPPHAFWDVETWQWLRSMAGSPLDLGDRIAGCMQKTLLKWMEDINQDTELISAQTCV